MNRRLYRSTSESILGGVAGGVAEYLDVDPSLVRIIWAVLAIVTGGIFVILYIVMWIVVPQAPWPMAPFPPAAPPAPPASGGEGGEPGGAASGEDAGGEATPADTSGAAATGAAATGAAATAAASGTPAAPPPAAGPPPGYPPHGARGPGSGALIVGLILIAIGAWFLVRQYIDINLDRLWPVGLVLLGVLLLVISLRRPGRQ